MKTVVNIPLQNGKNYTMEFVPTYETVNAEGDSHNESLMGCDTLKWGLILGLEERITYCDKQQSANEDVLDLGMCSLNRLIDILNRYAPDGFIFDLPTEQEWTSAFGQGVILSKDIHRYVELTKTIDVARSTPANSAGSGLNYVAYGIKQDTYLREYVSEVYGDWGCPVGIRLVLRKKKASFFNIDNATNLVRTVENKGGEILKDIIKNLRK